MAVQKKPKKGAPGWMVSFADLQQLLLVFFILLFSMSSVDENKFNSAMASLQEALHSKGLGLADVGITPENIEKLESVIDLEALEELNEQKSKQVDSELDIVNEFLENTTFGEGKLSDTISASTAEDGVVLTIKDIVLFDSGSAEIKTDAKKLLEALAPLIEQKEKGTRVEGHTDNVQLIDGSKYEDNWELSTARASKVIAFILEQKITTADKVSISGYAEYKPVATNDTKENKAKNRRVDIVLLSDFSKAEKIANDNIKKNEKLKEEVEKTEEPIQDSSSKK